MSEDYISGFFDADGSITMSYNSKKDKFRTIKMDFTNTKPNILLEIQDFLLKKYNIRMYMCTKPSRKKNQAIAYALSCCSNQQCYQLCSIIKSVHPKKLHRINTVLKYHNLVTKRNGQYKGREIIRRLAYERLFFSTIFQ